MTTRLPTEERQAEIVAATLKLASEVNPAQITTGQIADVVGVTQGALFKHFPTKDAIWQAVMGWVQGTLMARLDKAANKAASPVEALRAVFRAHVGFVADHPGVPRFLFHELHRAADTPIKRTVRTLLQRYRVLILKLLGDATAAGAVDADLDADAAATLFMGIVQGLVMQSMVSNPGPAAMKAQSDRVFAIYLRGLGVRS